jgi:peptidoglycan/xylan/chitin deacetylase (PgdA/CDA1 family)
VTTNRRFALLVCAFGLAMSALIPALSQTAASAAGAPAAPAGGMWLLGADGGVFALAGAPFAGSLAGERLNAPVRSLSATPSGRGYWIVASDGGVFSFGDAHFYGSTGAIRLNQPIVGMSPTPTGHGYWLVASDGGIFSFGDAQFYGSTGSIRLNQPIVGMSRTASGHGYWLVASDGGIFTFGDAHFYGSAGGQHLDAAIVGMARTSTGGGYWIVTQTGEVLAYGDAPGLGNALQGAQIAGLVPTFTGDGYWAASRDGVIRAAGSAGLVDSVRPAAPIVTVATRWASSGSSATLRATRTPVPNPGPLQAALTFDDGPDATYTPQILDVLAAYGVPATFFTVGYEGAARPDLLRAEAAAGNAVEDHTWNHPDLTTLPASEVASQLSLTADVIQQATGVRPTCFRPPYEATNGTVTSIAAGLGLTQTLWNVDPTDWKRPGVSAIVNNVLANSRGRGVIVLMHDGGGDRSQTVAALPLIITGLRNQGYQFVQPCA